MASRKRCGGFRQSQVHATRIKFSSSPRNVPPCTPEHPRAPPRYFRAPGSRSVPFDCLRYDYCRTPHRRCIERMYRKFPAPRSSLRDRLSMVPVSVRTRSFLYGYAYLSHEISNRGTDEHVNTLARRGRDRVARKRVPVYRRCGIRETSQTLETTNKVIYRVL